MAGHLTIFVTRTRGPFWSIRPARPVGDERLPEFHLANLSNRQPETIDHAAEYPEIVARLRQLHEAWAAEVTPQQTPETGDVN